MLSYNANVYHNQPVLGFQIRLNLWHEGENKKIVMSYRPQVKNLGHMRTACVLD